jgi:hypothetical protein
VLDIAVMSGHTGTINHDVVCGLLAEYLQDVCSTMLMMPYLFVCYWVFNFSLFLYLVVKLTNAAQAIITDDSGALLCQQVAELKAENS